MLRIRIFLALTVALVGVLVGAWLFTGGGVLQPLTKKLVDQRAAVVVTVADQLEQSRKPRRVIEIFAKSLNIRANLSPKKPLIATQLEDKIKRVEKGGRTIWIVPGRHRLMMTQVQLRRGKPWLVIGFPLDLEAPRRRIALGLLAIASCAGFAGWGLSQWSIRPLETASQAMLRIAAGDLDHRVEASIGPAGEAFNQMASRLQQTIEGQRQLMAAISHELRTPLARMRLQTEMLEDSGIEHEQLAGLNEDIQELDELVEALLASARLERGAIALQAEEIDLNALLMESFSKVDIGEREVHLRLGSQQPLFADKMLLLRVFVNLLSNTARYTPETTHIEIGSVLTNDQFHVWFADNGPGVPQDVLPHIFDPFVRAEQSRNKVTGGLGLGLMLVRQVVELHHGYVTATNRATGGLLIDLYFPLSEA